MESEDQLNNFEVYFRLTLGGVGVLGNCILAALALLSCHDVFIFNLATVDVLASGTLVVLTSVNLEGFEGLILGNTHCLVWWNLFVYRLFHQLSTYSLIALCIKTYVQNVRLHMEIRSLTQLSSFGLIALAWIFAILQKGTGTLLVTDISPTQGCFLNYPPGPWTVYHAIYIFMSSSLFPMVIMIVIYFRIFRVSKARPSRIEWDEGEKSLALSIFAIALTFIATSIPEQILFLFNTAGLKVNINQVLLMVIENISLVNTSIKPIMYFFGLVWIKKCQVCARDRPPVHDHRPVSGRPSRDSSMLLKPPPVSASRTKKHHLK